MSESFGALKAREPSAKYLVPAEPALIRGFGLVATSPGAIARLRELILLLAVRGMLVLQDQQDEPASLALGRMQAAKARLIADGAIKPDKTGKHISGGEVPLGIPPGWAWARLNQLTSILNGRAYAKQELLDSGTPVLRVGNLFTSKHWYYSNLMLEEAKYCSAGDLLFAWSASFGPFIWRGPKAIYHYHIWKLGLHSETDLDKDFLYTLLLEKTQEMKASGHGVSMIHMTKEAMEKIVVPLPPLAEQRRIVARVEELMKLCDALEQSGRLADEQHARLTSTLFDALAASESAHALAENWQRIAEHFDLLLDRPEAIDALEVTVLALAFQGKLVLQDSSEELGTSAAQMIGAGQPQPIDETEIPFEIPGGWRWIRLGWGAELVNGDRGKNYPNKSEYVAVGLPFINTGHIEPDGTLSRDSMHFVTRKKFDSLRGGKTRLGDLVYCLRGATLGKTAVVEYAEGAIASSLVIIRLDEAVARKYAYYFLISPLGRALVRRFDNGSAQPNLAANSVKRYVMPLPPLAEQHRIVARVEELRRLCRQLRERLTEARRSQSQLADALVGEVG